MCLRTRSDNFWPSSMFSDFEFAGFFFCWRFLNTTLFLTQFWFAIDLPENRLTCNEDITPGSVTEHTVEFAFTTTINTEIVSGGKCLICRAVFSSSELPSSFMNYEFPWKHQKSLNTQFTHQILKKIVNYYFETVENFTAWFAHGISKKPQKIWLSA